MHYSGANSYLFVNDTEIIKFKAKDSEIATCPLCLGNISEDWSVDTMKKTALKGCVYDFSVDYDAILVSDILDIHKDLMEKKGNSTCLKYTSRFATYKNVQICEVNSCFNNDVFRL